MLAGFTIENYLDYLQYERGVVRRTLYAYKYPLNSLRDSCNGEGITPEAVRKWYRGLKLKPNTLRTWRVTALAYLHWLRKKTKSSIPGLLEAIETLEDTKPPRYSPLTDCPKKDAVAEIMAEPNLHKWTGKRNLAILALLYSTLRISEVVNLQPDDLRLDEGLLIVRSGKGNKDRQVPLSPAVVKLIRQFLALPASVRRNRYRVCNRPKDTLFNISDCRIRRILHAYCKHAGIKDLQPHKLRKAGATEYFKPLKVNGETIPGLTLPEIQRLLGHADIKTTMIYLNISDLDVQDAIARRPLL